MWAGNYERPRTRSSVTIWHLPIELQLRVFKGTHVRDLLSLRQVCTHFHQITENHPCLWTHASFFNSWPFTDINLQVFTKAASHGSFEALIKLAIAKLYNQGLSEEQKQIPIGEKARQATEHFCQAEQVTTAPPFTWIFIRPPWAPSGQSCKAYVFEAMKEKAVQEKSQKSAGTAAICVAKILNLMEEHSEAATYFEQAGAQGSDEALFIQWLSKYDAFKAAKPLEPGRLLEAVRNLRRIVSMHCIESTLLLSSCYMAGKLGGISPQQACAFTRQLFQSSAPVNFLPILSPPHELNASMRYILVDWMVEVATMKNFSTLALHNSVAMVNRCLMIREFGRAQVQLLGVSAMVITSRFLSKEIITIKEAAWLTDNTYEYADVVKMMGEIMAMLDGQIRFTTACDFAHILEPICELSNAGVCLVDYITELCLLQANMATYSPAEIAVSSILLARVLMEAEEPWPAKLQKVTGFTQQDLGQCTFDIHEKCLLEDTRFDHRDSPLQAVKTRYSDETCPFNVTSIKIISHTDLQNKLGVADPVVQATKSKLRLYKAKELICSPSRGTRRRRPSELERPSREEALTPPLEPDVFGYEGDCEDILDDTDPFDLNDSFRSLRSEDLDSEVTTEPQSEPTSESDPLCFHFSKSCSHSSYIPGCSQISFSSPFAPQIRMSNCSCSACRTSGVGSSSSSSTSLQSFGFTPSSFYGRHSASTDRPERLCEEENNNVFKLPPAAYDSLPKQEQIFCAQDQGFDEQSHGFLAEEESFASPSILMRCSQIKPTSCVQRTGSLVHTDSQSFRDESHFEAINMPDILPVIPEPLICFNRHRSSLSQFVNHVHCESVMLQNIENVHDENGFVGTKNHVQNENGVPKKFPLDRSVVTGEKQDYQMVCDCNVCKQILTLPSSSQDPCSDSFDCPLAESSPHLGEADLLIADESFSIQMRSDSSQSVTALQVHYLHSDDRGRLLQAPVKGVLVTTADSNSNFPSMTHSATPGNEVNGQYSENLISVKRNGPSFPLRIPSPDRPQIKRQRRHSQHSFKVMEMF